MFGLVVLVADVLLNLLAFGELEQAADRPGPRVRAGIINGDLDRHTAPIEPAIALGHMQLFRLRPEPFQPTLVVESRRVDDERVLLPAADRVAHPRGLQIRWMTAAVQEDLSHSR